MIQSIGGIIYIKKDQEHLFFLMKRRAMSGKIEWVAPKGKIEGSEKPEFTCVREISEETGMNINDLHIKVKLQAGIELKNMNFGSGTIDKSISYFLVEYTGDVHQIVVSDVEGLTGMYKRCTVIDVMNLVPYKDLRAIFREAYEYLNKQLQKKKMIDSIII